MISRRGFLKLMGAAAAVTAGGIELFDLEIPSTTTYILPPTFGWSTYSDELSYIVRRAFAAKLVIQLYDTSPLFQTLVAAREKRGILTPTPKFIEMLHE